MWLASTSDGPPVTRHKGATEMSTAKKAWFVGVMLFWLIAGRSNLHASYSGPMWACDEGEWVDVRDNFFALFGSGWYCSVFKYDAQAFCELADQVCQDACSDCGGVYSAYSCN